MKIYLVGGYLRDKILGLDLSEKDKDYLVIGSTPEEMINLGYKQVGKSFPVFLHPETFEEYALARKEIKTGRGHQEFEFLFGPEITLEEDLQRRDFTINALVEDENGYIIDLINGLDDLENKTLRHISNHFVEDPLRVLRAARFHAVLNFEVAKETENLLIEMVKNGELESLSKERILLECQKTLMSGDFSKFKNYLEKIEVWNLIFGKNFKNYILKTMNFKQKWLFFLLGLENVVLEKMPLAKNERKLLGVLQKFEKLKDEEKWIDLLKIMDSWKAGGDFFEESLGLIISFWGKSWGIFREMRLFVREKEKEKKSEGYFLNFKGEAFGEALENVRISAINEFLKSNPLKIQ